MSLSMTRSERDAFLAGVHVGVISIEQPDAPPLTVPIWYDYRPDVGIWILTGEKSAKGQALQAVGRFSLCAQEEEAPNYRYVSVEGQVVDVRPADREEHARPMAQRYLGEKLGDLYTDGGDDENDASLVYTMRPERWRTVDYSKLGG
jgi:nitroimidazol reductase NimA-like FMN-containing flavoprotein (pyridoxamine 5'-phosphate oxidase superfamily)